MPAIWRNCKGRLLFDVLPSNNSFTAQLYCQKRGPLPGEVPYQRPNHPTIRFLQDSNRPYMDNITRRKVLGLRREFLILLLYRSNLAPSDCQMLLSMSNFQGYKTFFNEHERNQCLQRFFASKPKPSHRNGIQKLFKNGRKSSAGTVVNLIESKTFVRIKKLDFMGPFCSRTNFQSSH